MKIIPSHAQKTITGTKNQVKVLGKGLDRAKREQRERRKSRLKRLER